MNILIICGVFAKENEKEVLAAARRPVEQSANVFQEKLIRGFLQRGHNTRILSAPFIGSFPNASGIWNFTGFQENKTGYEYVSFNNIWGLRNFSRAEALKKSVRDFAQDGAGQKLIVVYSPHTPFLEAAAYAKKLDPTIKICMVIPDLPQYMNLDAKISPIYRIGKKYDIQKFNSLNRYVDSYVLLTEAMKKMLPVGDKPFCVVEGIIDPEIFDRNDARRKLLKKTGKEKYIVYTGKMNARFGVKLLVEGFMQLEDPSFRLVLCGSGDADHYIGEMAQKDPRILPMGQLPHDEAVDWMLRADVLVNPRENNEEYTKYSFPSKVIEYLATGNPTVGFLLEGMPTVYRDFMYTADEGGLGSAIMEAINASAEDKEKRATAAKEHLMRLTGGKVADWIVELAFRDVGELRL